MEFRVFLDGTQYADVDISQLERGLKRSDVDQGFVSNFSQGLKFYFAAYDYIRGVYLSNPCASIAIAIERKESSITNWEIVHAGFILCQEIEIDEKLCKISADIESNDVSDLLLNNMDLEIDLSPRYPGPGSVIKSINGTHSISAIKQIVRSFTDAEGTLLPNTSGADYAHAFLISNVFDFILQYISDGQIRLLSNFFTDTPSHVTNYEVEFNPVPTSPFKAFITVEDDLHKTYDISVQDNTQAGALNQLSSALARNDRGLFFNTDATTSPFHVADNSLGGTGIGTLALVKYEEDATIISASSDDPSVTVTVTKLSTFAPSGHGLYISDGYRLSNRDPIDKPFKMSFSKLLEIVRKFYDVSFQLEEVSGQWYCRIEPIETLLSNANTLTIQAPELVTEKAYKQRISSAITFTVPAATDGAGSGVLNAYNEVAFRFKNMDCNGAILNEVGDDLILSMEQFAEQINNLGPNDYEDKLFLFRGKELGTPGGSPDFPYYYEIVNFANLVYSTPTIFRNGDMLADQGRRLKRYLYFLPDKAGVYPYTNTWTAIAGVATDHDVAKTAPDDVYMGNELQYIRVLNFKVPLTWAEFSAIQTGTRIELVKGGTSRLGIILDLKYNVITGDAAFEILV